MLEAANTIISLCAILISIAAIYFSVFYERLEYEYKIDPQIEVTGVPQFTGGQSEDGQPYLSMEKLHVNIIEKNNLEQAYMIYTDGEIEKLELNNIENEIEAEIEKEWPMREPDIENDMYQYRYQFLCLKSLDKNYGLHLIYTKASPGKTIFAQVSGIEVYGLKNSHKDEAEYEGEKIMAQEYERILRELSKYDNILAVDLLHR